MSEHPVDSPDTGALEGFPMAPQQRRLWRLQQLSSGQPKFTVVHLRLRGTVDAKRLEGAILRTISRHEILRTRFARIAGMSLPLQQIEEAAALGFQEVEAPAELSLRELWAAEPAGPDPSAQIVEAWLVHEEGGGSLFLRLPSLCLDADGGRLWCREIALQYGGESPEAEPVQFVDIADWLDEQLVGDSDHLQWRRAARILATAPGLPLETAGVGPDSYRPQRIVWRSDGEEAARLIAAVEGLGGEPELAALLAWTTLLSRLTAQEEIVLGYACTGRGHDELREALGPYSRYLPLTFSRAPETTASSALADLLEDCTELRDLQESFAFDHLQAAGADQADAVPEFFSFGFAAEPRLHDIEAAGCRFSLEENAASTDRFTAHLAVRVGPQEILAVLSFDRCRVDPEEARWLVDRWRTLLRSLVDEPSRPLAMLDLLPRGERQLLVEQLTATDVDYGGPRWLDRLVLERAAEHPDAIAIVFGDRALTYGELERRVRLLAARLRGLGVGPEDRVGLLAERGPEMVVGMLGVLAAGGAYLPLEPEYPPQRLAVLLDDARPTALLTTADLRGTLPSDGPPVLEICRAGDVESTAPSSEPVPRQPGDLAYLIHTSGSSGKPKGVMVPHAAITNRILWMRQALCPTGTARVAFKTPFSFDASIWEIFLPLISGGRLVIAEPRGHRDPAYLARWVAEQRISILQLVPSMLGPVLEHARAGELSSLEHQFCGGEALPLNLRERFRESLPGASLHNLYGPTETSIDATHALCGPSDHGVAPIGSPIGNLRLYVLNEDGAILPLGMVGRLRVGGAGLARGYWNQPALTAERFLPDAFAARPGERLYDTGDLARWRPDGTLDYLGRSDSQVKIRGFRIEPGEVEATLLGCPGLEQAVVVADEDPGGNPRLVAYTVGEAKPERVRAHLEESLPPHLLPQLLVSLEELPRTSSGKIDRRALPRPETIQAPAPVEAPRGWIEQLLAGAWEQLLGIDGVSSRADFFEIGGHSLMATQLVSRIRDLFGAEITLREIFEKPTLAAQAAWIEGRGGGEADAVPALEAVPRDSDLETSFGQQRLWLIDQLDPGNPAYNIATGLRLEGALQVALVEGVLLEIVTRHESLRTTFAVAQGEPRQRIHRLPSFALSVVDLQGLVDGREEAAAELLARSSVRRFDLAEGPLFVVQLLRLGAEDHVACLAMHHIVSDGWSMGVLVREVAEIYRARRVGEEPDVAPLPFQYADFAAWQRRWLSGEILERQLGYWREQLRDAAPLLELPLDRSRPSVADPAAGLRMSRWPAELVEALSELSRRQGATRFITILALLQTLFHRYSGQRDLVLGTPTANRGRSELEGLIGFFVNTLVLRATVTADLAFVDLLQSAREVALGAHAHQDLPFERLVDELDIDRQLSTTPLFQVLFAYQNAPATDLDLSGLHLRPADELWERPAKFDQTWSVSETEGGELQLAVEFRKALFDPSTVERMLGHLARLAEGVVATPGAAIGDLPMLAEAERQQLRWEATRSPRPAASGDLLHRRFAAQAAASPDRIAVVSEETQLSYGELGRRASRLASRLVALGVSPESAVAVQLERGQPLIEALLGVLEAGAFYVPIDPSLPAARRRFLLADSGATVLLSSAPGELSVGGVREISPPEWQETVEGGDSSLDTWAQPDSTAAYSIYTSGSTGIPKGVLVSHANVLSLFDATRNLFEIGEEDVWTLFHSYAFDFSVWEIWGALLFGGRLVVVPYWMSRSPREFHHLLATQRVTLLSQTPSAFRQLDEVDAEAQEKPGLALRHVVFGGEALEAGLVDGWLRRHGAEGARLVNMYGITETTVHVTYREVREDDPGRSGSVIGRALASLEVQVLSSRGHLQPIGVPGELCVGGEGVSRGYVGRPRLTAERFVPDPHAEVAGSRLYRSGDLARWRGDGELEYLGRIDSQVKIRGFRVEPGEIEARLRSMPGVDAGVVVLRKDEGEDPRLVGYVVGQASPVDLRAGLQEELPSHMVPQALVSLDSLPLTVNGKLDIAGLPRPEAAAMEREEEAPRGWVAGVVATLYEDLLDLESVPGDGDFFALGGHSLLATRLLSRLRDVLEVEIGLRELFESPRVTDLARRVEELRGSVRFQAGPIALVDRRERLELSYGQQRLWFLDRLDPGNPAYNIETALILEGAISVSRLERVLAEIVRRHEILRTVFEESGGEPAQRILEPSAPVIAVVDLAALARAEEEHAWLAARRAMEASANRRFDLSRGPLLELTLLRLGRERHVVCVAMHHVVSDGWSMGVLTAEVAELYAALSEGRPAALPDLPVQYADYAAWQRSQLAGAELERQASYWREQLRGAPTVLELPTDRPRGRVAEGPAALRSIQLEPQAVASLRALARAEGATLFMGLLALLQLLLARYSSQNDVLVGTPIAHRTRSEVEPLIGFFINTLVMRGRIRPRQSFRDLLRESRETALAAHGHQDLPFERLLDDLDLGRQMATTPLFQVLFALQNLPQEELVLEGLTLRPADHLRQRTAKFDQTWVAVEQEKGLRLSLEYRLSLFDGSTIDRSLGHFATLLASACARPDEVVANLSLLAPGERHQLLLEEPAIDAPLQRGGLLHQRFSAWAQACPERVAIVAGDAAWSYGEIERRSGRLARRLHALGAGREMPVAVRLGRDADLVVALLAILKTGAYYLPLDRSLPAERVELILGDTGASLMIARGGETWPGMEVVDLDREAAALESGAWEAADISAPPRSAAYTIYTSGSTGRPKGVVVSHANALSLFDATVGKFGFGEDDVWSLFHSYAFDFSVWEIWGALLFGGRLVVVPYSVSRSPEDFAGLVVDQRVTHLSQTPSAFRQLIAVEQERWPEGALALRWIVFGGEALDPRMLRPWIERHGAAGPLLVNMYGITETTVHVTYREIAAADLDAGRSWVGKPIASLRTYVVDPAGHLQPLGAPGELWVSGLGVARGYLGRPSLTAERFVPDPRGSAPGARCYRSGDLARRSASGDLEYLGRIDNQVKIRGFRIEPGEIEAALLRMRGVEQVAVVPREDPDSERRLVAYWVGRSEADPRSHLATQLPEHMIPQAFVWLDALPLTPNGKLDRDALPAPESGRSKARPFVAPTEDREEVLAGIWSRVLGIDQVGAEDNFFDLGGDSILSVQVLAQARERGYDLSLPQLFQYETLGELAESLTTVVEPLAEEVETEPFELVDPGDRARMPADIEDAYPLTRLQAGMLFHMELRPDDPPYHNVDSFHLQAPFDHEAMQRAVDLTVARHPVLRTSFWLSGFSQPLQLVHREVRLQVQVEDLRALSFEEQERIIDGHIAAEKKRLHDFVRPPQLRFYVHLRSDDTFQFSLTENHAILDGWSLHSTLAEMFASYHALAAGEEVLPTPRPSFLFRDFVAAETRALAAADSLAFWDGYLKDATVTTVPRWSRGAPPRSRLAILPVAIPEGVSEGLKAIARQCAVPLKSVLLAAHCKALSVLSGSHDVVSGLTSHGRPEVADAFDTRGLFLNTIPVRLALPRGSWKELAVAAFEAERQLLPHRAYPAAALQQERGGDLFEAAFNYVHFHVLEGLVDSGQAEVLGFKREEGTNFVLMAGFSQELGTGSLRLVLECDAAELGDSRVAIMGEVYSRVLRQMSAAPDTDHRLSTWLDSAARHQSLREWNDTGAAYAEAEETLVSLFLRQVSRTPDAIALRYGDSALTYAEAARRGTSVAAALRGRSYGVDAVVAVVAQRSLNLVPLLFGIQAAGAAYLPIDPDETPARRRLILQEAGPCALVADRALLNRLDDLDLPAFATEDLVSGTAAEPLSAAEPEALAYVIYTSGSTGMPKGVMNSHRGIVNRLLWMQEQFGLTGDDRVLQKTPYTFDVSVWELFWPLITGAQLVLARPGGHRDAAYLARLLARCRVTTLHFVPSLLRVFLEEPDLEECSATRRWICSGEALTGDLRALFYSRAPGELFNLYGPTEAAVDVTVHSCRQAVADGVVPIGRPIDNLRIYLSDEGGQLVPPGSSGELLIGGVGVARGYLHRPSLTAERFVPDPFGDEPGGRLYRSGDLARALPDGAIEFRGRLDHQVKIRGFRIELGEIEAALSSLSSVREAAVVVEDGESGPARLFAYVVAAQGEEVEPSALRRNLEALLPAYMVPARFILLEEMPLTSSGKVDRRALPDPGERRPELERSYVPPQTSAEVLLAGQWQALLGVEPIGVEDSFFELGGDSIRSIQLVAQARQAGLEFSLQELLEHPTIRQLAARAEWVEPSAPVDGLTRPFELISADDLDRLPEGVEDAYPLATLQTGMLFHSELDPETAVYHDVVSHHLGVGLDRDVVEKALRQTVARHPVLRTSFEMALFSEPLQLVHREVEIPIGTEDLSELNEEAREQAILRWVEAEKARGFDWRTAPIFRVQLHRRGPEEFQFSLSFHHAILDGWSLASLLTELFQLYLTLLGRAEAEVPAQPVVTFRDYISLERQAVASEEQGEFWDRRLEGLVPTILPRLPGRRAEGPGVEELRVELRPEDSAGLKELAASTGVPLKSVLLAAHLTALGDLVGLDDVVTGLVLNGRPEGAGSEQVLGLFLNSLPFRQSLAAADWPTLVRQVFENEKAMMPWRRYPMAEVQRRLGNLLLFESAFNYTHFHVLEGVADVGGVEVLGSVAFEQTNFAFLAGFSLNLTNAEVELRLTWDRQALTANQVAGMAETYRRVLVAMATADGGPGADRETGAATRHQVLLEWNDTAADLGGEGSVSAAFEATAARWPERVAVVDDDRVITFGALSRKAERMAMGLAAHGVGPEVKVSLMVKRSIDLIAAILATSRVGGAFVPLDPDHPAERLSYILEDSGASLLVTDRSSAPGVDPSLPRLTVADLERARPAALPSPADLHGQSLAYVVYTSGSTGKPKGVAVPQRAILRLVRGGGFADLGPDQVFLQMAPVSFDASTLELWGPLLNGGRLVLAPPERLSLKALALLLARYRISILWLTAGLFHQMVDSELEALGGLRELLAGGDSLSRRHCERVVEAWPRLTLINGYGPTENTTFTTCHRMRGPQPRLSTVPVGRPIAETRVVIVDRFMRTTGVGTPGELLTGGLGLARAYHGRPGLTAAAFVPDAFSQAHGERLYRTGDQARWLPDGNIEFLGRTDGQVKIRGFRIETGEVETALVEQPAVAEAVVLAMDEGDGRGRSLVAYVVPDPAGPEPRLEDLRSALVAKLPDYMVPSRFVVLEELPLTVNGKLDRRALPVVPGGEKALETVYVAPASPAQELVIEVLASELGEERVGMTDDFFALGGHSLTATRLAARLSDVFRVELPLRVLFEAPTAEAMVAELANRVGGADLLDEVANLYRSIRDLSDDEVQRLLEEEADEASADGPGEDRR